MSEIIKPMKSYRAKCPSCTRKAFTYRTAVDMEALNRLKCVCGAKVKVTPIKEDKLRFI